MTGRLSTSCPTYDQAKAAIIRALVARDMQLRSLGHAHARLDANARHLIAEAVLEAVEYQSLFDELARRDFDIRGALALHGDTLMTLRSERDLWKTEWEQISEVARVLKNENTNLREALTKKPSASVGFGNFDT